VIPFFVNLSCELYTFCAPGELCFSTSLRPFAKLDNVFVSLSASTLTTSPILGVRPCCKIATSCPQASQEVFFTLCPIPFSWKEVQSHRFPFRLHASYDSVFYPTFFRCTRSRPVQLVVDPPSVVVCSTCYLEYSSREVGTKTVLIPPFVRP